METHTNSIKNQRLKKLGPICLFIGLVFYISINLSNTNLIKKNIFVVKGTVRVFLFNDLGRKRFDYNIFLNENSKTYQIIASLREIFKKESFESEVLPYDSIKLTCLKPGFIDLTKSVRIIEINCKGKTYLSSKNSKEILESESSNVKIISFVLMGIGFVLIIWNLLKKNILNNT